MSQRFVVGFLSFDCYCPNFLIYMRVRRVLGIVYSHNLAHENGVIVVVVHCIMQLACKNRFTTRLAIGIRANFF